MCAFWVRNVYKRVSTVHVLTNVFIFVEVMYLHVPRDRLANHLHAYFMKVYEIFMRSVYRLFL